MNMLPRLLVVGLLGGVLSFDEHGWATESVHVLLSDMDVIEPFQDVWPNGVQPAEFLEPAPPIRLQIRTPLTIRFSDATARFLSALTGRGLSTDSASGSEAALRQTTDAASLAGKSPSILGLGMQRRNPIINDTRIRGGRIGRQPGHGSYWVPARIDLDTALSKMDSRDVEQITVIKGPYSALYGPGFSFTDVQLKQSPRYVGGYESHGATSFDYKTNGEHLYGRQSIWGGDEQWGFRAAYGHRTGNDYLSGNDTDIPSSYKSRDFDLALGRDLEAGKHLEFNYLRLDQTDVELPGQAFDIDFLVTNGFDLKYVDEEPFLSDRMVLDVWYNQTHFVGSTGRPGKHRTFPFYDTIKFEATTDVDSASLGYQFGLTWGENEDSQLTVGTDLRYVRQELTEIAKGIVFGTARRFGPSNSPLPKSDSLNPGWFVEYTEPLSDRLQLRTGGRLDLVQCSVLADAATLTSLGANPPQSPPSSLADILGTDQFDQVFLLGAAHVVLDYQINDCWSASLGGGFAERAPNLTELYVAQSFMFVLQNGVNTLTGDPQLDPERLWQLDANLKYTTDRLRLAAHGFHSWIHDYITFELFRTFPNPAVVYQESLKYVNTDLATLAGFELRGEYDATPWLTPFATMNFVEGRDHSRNGDFATRRAANGNPSTRVYGLPRGSFGGIAGASEEPLPSIAPLEARLGLRLHAVAEQPSWGVELTARIVDNQDRVATSLLEQPTPDFTVWDIRSYWRPTEGLQCVAGVENFTNKNYREHLDFRSQNGLEQLFQPGVTFYVGLERTY